MFAYPNVIRKNSTSSIPIFGRLSAARSSEKSNIAAAGAFAASNAADVTILNFDMGGAVNVLAGVLDGAAVLANTGAATTAASQVGYLVAYDAGNAFLYSYNDANGGGTLDATEIALIGTVNGVAVGGFNAANFVMAV